MDWNFANKVYLFLFPVLLVMVFFLYRFYRWKNAAEKRLVEEKFHSEVLGKKKSRIVFVGLLFFVATSLLILSMADLVRNDGKESVGQEAKNLVFLLDISNSMKAEDIEPSRLGQAKNIILNTLENNPNLRAQVIVFAGEARIALPLTSDLIAAENMISAIQPEIIEEQGTDFQKAIDLVVMTNVDGRAKNVVMISDGEDNEAMYQPAIQKAKKYGVRINTVGVGTEEGAPIPDDFIGNFSGYKISKQGETVISKREEKSLKEIAQNTSGEYIDGNELYSAIEKINQAIKQDKVDKYEAYSENTSHYYQYFLVASFLLFIIIYLTNPKMDFNI